MGGLIRAWVAVGAVLALAGAGRGAVADYVIHISVDGLGGSHASTYVANNPGSSLARFVTQGAYTNNARNDYDLTITLPNHVTMATGRGVNGAAGHNWTMNVDPSADPGSAQYSIQNNKGSYVASVFDVAHDAGLSTGLYASKSKFVLFRNSYGTPGAAGSKLDAYVNDGSTNITASYLSRMSSNPLNYSFVHYHNPDTDGHDYGWGSSQYYAAVAKIDGFIGQIFNLVETSPAMKDHTTILLTADHGGSGTNHADATVAAHYTIPFYAWGAGVAPGELYAMNAGTRLDPGTGRPLYSDSVQPIRNGDGANLALELLGLGPVPGSTLNFSQNLNVPEPGALGVLALAAVGLLRRGR